MQWPNSTTLAQWGLLPPLTSTVMSSFTMHIPVHSPWLPGYVDVGQTVLVVLTMVGLFLDRPYMLYIKMYACHCRTLCQCCLGRVGRVEENLIRSLLTKVCLGRSETIRDNAVSRLMGKKLPEPLRE